MILVTKKYTYKLFVPHSHLVKSIKNLPNKSDKKKIDNEEDKTSFSKNISSESVFPTPIFHSLNEIDVKTAKNNCFKEINDEEGMKKNENENLANVLEEFFVPQHSFEKADDADEPNGEAEINKDSQQISENKENEHKFSFAENEANKIKGSQINFKV